MAGEELFEMCNISAYQISSTFLTLAKSKLTWTNKKATQTHGFQLAKRKENEASGQGKERTLIGINLVLDRKEYVWFLYIYY